MAIVQAIFTKIKKLFEYIENLLKVPIGKRYMKLENLILAKNV